MIIWVRNIVLIFVMLSIVYAFLSFRASLRQRAKLDAEYLVLETKTGKTNAKPDRDAFLAKGMQAYHKSFRPKLLFGVFLIPLAIISMLIYLAQNT